MNVTGLNSNFEELTIDTQEEYKGPDLFSELPIEVITKGLAPFLSPKDLKSLSETSRTFRDLTSLAIKDKWPKVRASITVGPEQWRAAIEQGREHLNPDQQEKFKEVIDRLFRTLDEVPPLPDNIDEILKAPCPFWEGRVYQTQRLVLIPGGLSINLLGALMKFLKTEGEDNGTVFKYIWPQIVEELGDQIASPHWVLMTRDMIPDSLDIRGERKKKLLEQFPDYELPTALESIASVITRFERLLPGELLTYTHCKEKIEGYPIVVGAFGHSGLEVTSLFDEAVEADGIVLCRKFF